MEVKKHLIVTGSSETSWKDAIVQAISETSKTMSSLTIVLRIGIISIKLKLLVFAFVYV